MLPFQGVIIDYGPGYRVYFIQKASQWILLLAAVPAQMLTLFYLAAG